MCGTGVRVHLAAPVRTIILQQRDRPFDDNPDDNCGVATSRLRQFGGIKVARIFEAADYQDGDGFVVLSVSLGRARGGLLDGAVGQELGTGAEEGGGWPADTVSASRASIHQRGLGSCRISSGPRGVACSAVPLQEFAATLAT